MIKYCRTCSYFDKNKEICALSGLPMDGDKDYCSKHTDEFLRCEVCGNIMFTLGSIIEIDNNGECHQYCARCRELLRTCQTCSAPCEFETNPDPMPKVVMKTVRQGNMQMQAQIMNPERVEKFCLICGCYEEGIGCKRQFNVGCDKKTEFWTSRNS